MVNLFSFKLFTNKNFLEILEKVPLRHPRYRFCSCQTTMDLGVRHIISIKKVMGSTRERVFCPLRREIKNKKLKATYTLNCVRLD